MNNYYMTEDKKIFKILSIDGGGVKALYSLYVLKQIEEYFCTNDTVLSDYFDMICGTSSGGIIALAIALRIPIVKIIRLYEDNVETIFPGKNYNSYIQPLVNLLYSAYQLTGCKYDNTELKKQLYNFFGDKTLKDIHNLICIPSYNVTTGSNVVFKNNKNHSITLYDIALATASAPTFFESYYIDNSEYKGYYVDGGIWANNPTSVAINEFIKNYINTGYDSFDVLSIGNIHITNNPEIKYDKTYWNIFKFDKLLSLFYESEVHSENDSNIILCKFTNSHMTRIECKSYTHDISYVKMDNSNVKFLKILKHLGNTDGILAKQDKYNIKRFFTSKKTIIL